MRTRIIIGLVLACTLLMASASKVTAAPPTPIGNSHIQVSYMTDTGPVSFFGDRGYGGNDPLDASNLGGAPNIGAFSSQDLFSWRNRVQPFHPTVVRPNETVISQAFFKVNQSGQANNSGEFFPGLVHDGDITIHVTNLKFDQPVFVEEGTFLLHTLWDIDQMDMLGDHAYHHHHNVHSATDPYRDMDDFFSPIAAFADHPVHNFTLGTITPIIQGEGTDTLSISLTLPYHMLKNLEEMGHMPPPAGLPAPQGFLEPFHVHFEYVVIPEPSVLTLTAVGALAMLRRRKV